MYQIMPHTLRVRMKFNICLSKYVLTHDFINPLQVTTPGVESEVAIVVDRSLDVQTIQVRIRE
jgi:hypothetical protein